MCQLSQNKPHNGRLAALFPEVTHEELEYIVGFDQEEIQLSLISLWGKIAAYRILSKITDL